MHPDIARLSTLVEEASSILHAHAHPSWATWLAQDARRIRALDFYGLEHLLSAYGGMGSLNDVVLSASQHGTNKDINERFDTVRQQIYELATKLAREER